MEQKNSFTRVTYLIGLGVLCFIPIIVNAQFTSQVDCFLPVGWEGKETKLIVQPLNQKIVVDTAMVVNRHVRFEVRTPDLSSAYIWIEGNNEDIHFLLDSPQINIAFDPQASIPIVISGSSSSELWQRQRHLLDQLVESNTEIRIEFPTANTSNDSLSVYEKLTDSLRVNYQDAIVNMIKENASSASSWYLFTTHFSILSYKTAVDLFNELSAFNTYPSYKIIERKLAGKLAQGKSFELASTGLSDDLIDVSKLKYKLILIDFSDSHLLYCQWRHASLKKLYKTYHSLGLEIITVSREFDKKSGKIALQNELLPWLVTMADDEVFEAYNVERMPDNLLLDANKTVIGRDMSIQDLTTKFKGLIK